MLMNGFCSASAGGSSRAVPLCWWQGWSGRWYVASAMPIQRVSCAAPGFFLLVHRSAFGNRTPVTLGCSDNVERTLMERGNTELAAAIRAGANEVHVNLLGEDMAERAAAVKDIARGWDVPVSRLCGRRTAWCTEGLPRAS